MNCLITIITINLNNLHGLRKTVESVFLQDYTNIEYLIIDGASKDGSVNFIESNKHKFDYWVSESDDGIYDAMNKGIIQAKGEYLLFLNSGDILYSSDAISKLIGDNIFEDLVYGKLGVYKNSSLEIIAFPSKLRRSHFQYGFLPHQATLIKRSLFFKFGFYKTQFKIISDWIFFLDLIIKGNPTYRYVDHLISIFDLTGISSQPANRQIITNEIKCYLKKNYVLTYWYFKVRWLIIYYPIRILKELRLKRI